MNVRIHSLHWWALFIGLITLSLYASTIARESVNIADSNELIVAAYSQGLAHPPSYPLYSLILQSVFRFVSKPDIAVVAHSLAALLSTVGVVLFFYVSVTLLTLYLRLPLLWVRFFAFSGSMALAFSQFYWDQARFAEVFSFNSIFLGSLLLAFFTGYHTKRPMLFALLFGFAVAHHQINLLLLPAILWKQSWLPINRIIPMIGGFLFGFIIPYVLLLPTVNTASALSWYFEPTFHGFLDIITRGVYAPGGSAIETYTHEFNVEHSLVSILIWIKHVINHFGLPASVIMLIGFWRVYSQSPYLKRFFLLSVGIPGFLLAAYLKFPLIEQATDQLFYHGTYLRLRMFTLAEYVLALLIPLGLGYSYLLIKKKLTPKYTTIIPIGIAFIVLSYPLLIHYPQMKNYSTYRNNDVAEAVFSSLPEKAVLLVDSDLVFSLLYHQSILNTREDVLIIPTAMHMRWGYMKQFLPDEIFSITGYYRFILAITEWGMSTSPSLFVLSPTDRFIHQMKAYHYRLVPHGLVTRIETGKTNLHAEKGYTVECHINSSAHPWLRGEWGELAGIYISQAALFNTLNDPNEAEERLQLAKNCTQAKLLLSP